MTEQSANQLPQNLVLYFDGSCMPQNPGGIASGGWVIYDMSGHQLQEGFQMVMEGGEYATNNYAEYCGLGLALRWLKDQNWKGNLTIRGDSKLIIRQMQRVWSVHKDHLRTLRERCLEILDDMGMKMYPMKNKEQHETPSEEDANYWLAEWIPREKNTKADELSKKSYELYVEEKQRERDIAKPRTPTKK